VTVEVIIGHHVGDDEHRTAARRWIVDWWRSRGYDVTVGVATGDMWCKADAYNPAVASSSADMVILADADSWPDPDALTAAIGKAQTAGWAAPFTRVRRLTYDATATVLGCDPAITNTPPDTHTESDVHDALPGGGVVIMRRDLALACGPYDPRFKGWAGEDFALGNAARTLTGGYAAQIAGSLWHLWHPRATVYGPDTPRLIHRYRLAKFNGDVMRELIDEWRTDGTG
jgi:hypothetical protein